LLLAGLTGQAMQGDFAWYKELNSLDTEIKKNLLYAENDYNGFDILRWNLAVIPLPHAHATHSLQAVLFVSLHAQLQSTPCICHRSDSRFCRSFSTVLITLANNPVFSKVLKMSAEEIETNYLHIIAIVFACYD
jgi:hypothetical protein